MATRRLRGAERRESILEAATKVFAERGFEGARMDDVAQAAGVAKGLLYKHFPSKSDLIQALVEREGDLFSAKLRATQSITTDADALLQDGLTLWLRQLISADQINFAAPLPTDPGHDLRNRIRATIRDLILVAEPRVPAEIALLLAAALQGAAQSMGETWRDLVPAVADELAQTLLTGFCWRGLGGLREDLEAAG